MNEAIAETVRVNRRLFLNVARKFAATGIDPEDCVQDATVQALRFAKDFRGQNLSSWIGTIVRNCALYTHRKQKPVFSLEEPIGDDITLADTLRDRKASVEETIYARQILVRVGQLPEKYRNALEVTCLRGDSIQDAAREMGLPVGTMKARISRARRALRKRVFR